MCILFTKPQLTPKPNVYVKSHNSACDSFHTEYLHMSRFGPATGQFGHFSTKPYNLMELTKKNVEINDIASLDFCVILIHLLSSNAHQLNILNTFLLLFSLHRVVKPQATCLCSVTNLTKCHPKRTWDG